MQKQEKYWAFISYSHQDVAWSDWLFKALETYRIPGRLVGRETHIGRVPPRLFPIFRDRDELPGSAELSTNLVDALKSSRYLLVICSPHAARSRWVNEEARTFKSLRGDGRILALVVSGEPNASDRPDSGMLECFPAALRFKHVDGEATEERVEPIAADVRSGKDGKALALLKLIAGIIGVDFDELRQRERQRARARNIRLALEATTLGVAALMVSSWLWIDARIERNIENGRTAMMSRDYARAAPWLVSAAKMQDLQPFVRERPYLAAMLGLAMAQVELLDRIETFPGSASYAQEVNHDRTLLALALQQSKIVVASLGEPGGFRAYDMAQKDVNFLRFDASDKGLLYHGGDAIYRLDLASGNVTQIARDPKDAKLWAITPYGRAALYRYKDHREFVRLSDGKVLGRFSTPRMSRLDDLPIYDEKGEKTLATAPADHGWSVFVVDLVRGDTSRTLAVDFDPSAGRFDATGELLALTAGYHVPNDELATAGRSGAVGIWNLATGSKIWESRYPAKFQDVSFSGDGARLITTSQDHRAIVWDALRGNPEVFLEDLDALIRDAYFFPGDSSRVVTLSQDGSPRVWDVATGAMIAKLEGLDGYFARVTALPDGKGVVAWRTQGPGQLLRWKLDDRRIARALAQHRARLWGASVTANGARVLSVDEKGVAVVWDARDLSPLATVAGTTDVVLSVDGRRYFSSVAKTGEVRIGDVDSGRVLANHRLEHALTRIAGWNARGVVVAADSENQVVSVDSDLHAHVLKKFGRVQALDTSTDGRRVAVVAEEGGLEILDGATGARIASFPKPALPERAADPWLEFSRLGDRVLVTYYRKPEIVDVEAGKRHPLDIENGAVPTISYFVCDDEYVALQLDNHRFQLHDGRTGEHLRDFDGASAFVVHAACDRRAQILMASDRDGRLTIWRLNGGAPIAQFKLSADGLTDTLWIPGIRSVLAASSDSRIYALPIPLETRTPAELEASLRCRTPYRVSGDALVRQVATDSCSAHARDAS